MSSMSGDTAVMSPLHVSDSTGATSGASTPNKEVLQNKDLLQGKRTDNYNSAALAKIRQSLQTYKKDDAKDDDLEVRSCVRILVES